MGCSPLRSFCPSFPPNDVDAEPELCPICAEAFAWSRRRRRGRRLCVVRPCCSQPVCRSCLHSHVLSVFTEAAGGGGDGAGRTRLLCPLGCGRDITDGEVRASLRNANRSILHHAFGARLFRLLRSVGWFREARGVSCGSATTASSKYHAVLVSLTQSPAERRQLAQCERWSLTVALGRNRSEERRSTEDVIHCPVADCGYIWIANAPYRREKLENERRFDGGNMGDGRGGEGIAERLLRAASTYLFYRPPRQEDDTAGNSSWIDSEDLSTNTRGRDRRAEGPSAGVDGRRVVCVKCQNAYCGLCRRPWTYHQTARNGRAGRREVHTGRLCSAFAVRVGNDGGAEDDDEYTYAADAANGRMCPGCSLRTSRIDGCNHMTCPCGFEWCYVCECRWNALHYRCADGGPRIGNRVAADGALENLLAGCSLS